MVRYNKRRLWRGAEAWRMGQRMRILDDAGSPTLFTVPSHILDHEQSAIVNEDEVEQPVADDGPLIFLDDAGQHT